MSRRGSGPLPPAAALAAGLAGSVLVAALVGVPPRDLVVVLGLGAVGALTVAVVGLALQALLRRRRSTTATQDAVAAAVTAAAAAAAIGAVSGSMLLSQHDLAVVLAEPLTTLRDVRLEDALSLPQESS